MKPQTRPFVVETKTRRRPAQASTTSWSTVIGEPSSDDLPSRDIRVDGSASEIDTPFAAANRVFSAFASSAISTASTLGDFAESVFGPSRSQDGESESRVAATGESRTGRILPSLSPLNQFETRVEGEARSISAPLKKGRKRAPKITDTFAGPEPAKEPSREVVTEQASTESFGATPQSDPERLLVRQPRHRKRDPSGDRVRAGEGWKRRRLPKAMW
jgi:hypothetical protein